MFPTVSQDTPLPPTPPGPADTASCCKDATNAGVPAETVKGCHSNHLVSTVQQLRTMIQEVTSVPTLKCLKK